MFRSCSRANADPESPLFGKPYIGVASTEAFETVEHSVPAAAVNAVADIFPTSWEMTKGAVKVLNPVNIFTHLAGTNDDLETRPTTLVGVTGVSDDVGDSAGFVGILYLLAVLFAFRSQARQSARPIRSLSYGRLLHLTLLSTPPHGGAVTFSYRPEWACLKEDSPPFQSSTLAAARARASGPPHDHVLLDRELPARS